MNDLALLDTWEGKFAESEALLTRAMEIARRILSEEDTLRFTMMANLAWLYQEQGAYARAEELSAQALEGTRRMRGAGHFDTLRWIVIRASLLEKERGEPRKRKHS